MPAFVHSHHLPQLSQAAAPLVCQVSVVDERGRSKPLHVPAERPLTIYLNKQETVTLMTLGAAPEALVLGWLRNQQLVQQLHDVQSIQVDWGVSAAAVQATPQALQRWQTAQHQRTVTSGCGQGSLYGDILANLDRVQLNPQARLDTATVVNLVAKVRAHPSVYKQAGSVHGCGLFRGSELLHWVEDVGRHNAVDAIAGLMWLHQLGGDDLVFYTTGRLTSEMVIKGAQMGIPFLLSRSGVTRMGLDMAQRVGLTLIGRCSGEHFLVYHGQHRLQWPALNTDS
ncbi:MAG: formate dehydrogenase accessory sulfurtransferase FdhD [Burkholderiaceae bacterium]